MSNSRLEKFIYAICGMEIDDLPTPLSRIEMLWNCLITGETPDFEPLSRNEKYLMSMLTGDVDALPEPASRSEKLLYKIATGETDLTDVPGYLSRYEELLKYLIENGGIGGTDFEYVLYTLNDSFSTLYSTAEAPVKSAILKGNTLVNLFPIDEVRKALPADWKESSKGVFEYTSSSTARDSVTGVITLTQPLIAGKTYILKHDSDNTTDCASIGFIFPNETTGTWYQGAFVSSGILNPTQKSVIYTPNKDIKTVRMGRWNGNYVQNTTVNIKYPMILEYQQGMENWDIPYFEGMQSVKMPVLTATGKNLIGQYEKIVYRSGRVQDGAVLDNDGNFTYVGDAGNRPCLIYKINPNTDITISSNVSLRSLDIYEYSDIPNFTKEDEPNMMNMYNYIGTQKSITRTTSKEAKYIGISFYNDSNNTGYTKLQLEYGLQATVHEPFKTNILSCNEEVTLRGIGEVKDTLDGNSGVLTQRIGEVVLDGSVIDSTIFRKNGSSFLMIRFNKIGFKKINDTINIILSKLHNVKYYSSEPFNTGDIMSDAVGWGFGICFATNETATRDEAIAYLNNLKPVIQGCLETPVIKTVVLSTLDQDGQPTKLKTFNDISHVSIEAEVLLPTVDLEVATKIEETLSSLPTQMIDISETQQSLNEKIDEQAENIKEVSTAMIEIRNDIL